MGGRVKKHEVRREREREIGLQYCILSDLSLQSQVLRLILIGGFPFTRVI